MCTCVFSCCVDAYCPGYRSACNGIFDSLPLGGVFHELVVGFEYLVLSGLTVLVHQYHSSSCFSKSQKGIV